MILSFDRRVICKEVSVLRPLSRMMVLVLCLCLFVSGGWAETAEKKPLPLNKFVAGPKLKSANFDKNNKSYDDGTISVKIESGKYLGVHYITARVKISHASQLRAVSAQQVRNPSSSFLGGDTSSTATGMQICKAVNAVIGMNGDYCITDDKCQVMMRQCQQIRNRADGRFDVLIIDKNGDFSAIRNCTANDYKKYYNQHKSEMYNVFCFGPVLVKNGRTTIGEKYQNRDIIAREKTQRAAIAQIGPLEYMLIVSDGDSVGLTEGLTLMEFSKLCAKLGREAVEGGFKLAFNLDGGNSSALIYKTWRGGKLNYAKLNMPNIGRPLSDMICFFSLGAE